MLLLRGIIQLRVAFVAACLMAKARHVGCRPLRLPKSSDS